MGIVIKSKFQSSRLNIF